MQVELALWDVAVHAQMLVQKHPLQDYSASLVEVRGCQAGDSAGQLAGMVVDAACDCCDVLSHCHSATCDKDGCCQMDESGCCIADASLHQVDLAILSLLEKQPDHHRSLGAQREAANGQVEAVACQKTPVEFGQSG